MDRLWTNPSPLSLLAALVPSLVQAQPLAQRKPWLVGLGATLAFLFLIFVLTLVYAICCSESRESPFHFGYLGPSCLHSNKDKEEETVRKEEGEGDWGLELEEKEEPPNHETVASSST
ncbi:Small integral membrane protein 24 [Camelus dromedarius]|uniref:Small integral membrane protein 24 n=1 Tax=Camelus dromedarius TaxID=9838 RepID=A0A5N4CK28_CAMDR|nr:Small integral membrane protein 24 [Camelus dromedarius]